MKYLVNFAFALLIVLSNNCYSQETDFSLARVGIKTEGVYIFIQAEPYQPYDYIATVKVDINWTGKDYDTWERVVTKAKRKHQNFNGIIFKGNDYSQADLIKFKGLEVSRGGLKVGNYVAFIIGLNKSKTQYVGEIIELESQKNKASVKYTDIFGYEKIQIIDYKNLTELSTEEYSKKLAEHFQKVANHKFVIGDKVSWVSSGKQRNGEVIAIDNKANKASIKYIGKYDKEKIAKISFLELAKNK